MFSNRADNSHMIQCDMPSRRSASAAATATAPTLAWPCSHSQMPSAATANTSAMFSVYSAALTVVARRICRYTVSRNPSIASRA